MQVKAVGDAVGQGGQGVTGGEVTVSDGRVAVEGVRVVGERAADEDPDVRARDRGRRDPGALQRLPGELQQDALLRVHLLGFAR